ncbi:hypothetical protein A9R05_44930 (plasmid) [Burkholderia sp. KK1]|nr:hypothetical protein A9R05_44930 [Burkholderia sp. KK1]
MTNKIRTITVNSARAQRAAGLINDFMMQRVAGGWCILVMEVGEQQSLIAVCREDATTSVEDEACIFDTADEALGIVYGIGFDVSTQAIGFWRHDPKHMEGLLADAKELLRRSLP